MRLIQFDSGLCVVLKDVQHDSSMTTSISSNGSNRYYTHRKYALPSHHQICNLVKTPSAIIVEVKKTLYLFKRLTLFVLN